MASFVSVGGSCGLVEGLLFRHWGSRPLPDMIQLVFKVSSHSLESEAMSLQLQLGVSAV